MSENKQHINNPNQWTPAENAARLLKRTRDQFRRLALTFMSEEAIDAADELTFGFYLVTKRGAYSSKDPLLVDEGSQSRAMPHLKSRDVRAVTFSMHLHEVSLSVQLNPSNSDDFDPIQAGLLEPMVLSEAVEGMLLGGVPIDLAAAMDPTLSTEEGVLGRMDTILRDIETAPLVRA